MKEFKGTKGIWKMGVFDRNPWSEGIDISGDDYDIALMVGNLKDLPDEEIEEIKANARAISAVPEMIEALQNITELKDTGEDAREMKMIALEALKKALG